MDLHTGPGRGWTGSCGTERTCEAVEDKKWIRTEPGNPEWTASLHIRPKSLSAGRRPHHHLRTYTHITAALPHCDAHTHTRLRLLPCRSGPRQVIRLCRQRPRLRCTSGWVGGADNSRRSTKVKVDSARARNRLPERSMMRARLCRAQV